MEKQIETKSREANVEEASSLSLQRPLPEERNDAANN